MSDNPLTPERRKHFEGLGLDVVKQDLAAGGHTNIGGGEAREAAKIWIKEQEDQKERKESKRHADSVCIARFALAVAVLSLIVSCISLIK